LDLGDHLPFAERFYGRFLRGSGPLVALQPWAGGRLRCWPLENVNGFLNLALRESGCRVVLTGGTEDAAGAAELVRRWGPRVIRAAGRMRPAQTWALLALVDVLVSVDTCTIHMAAALDKPVVSLFGAGDPLVWGPHGQMDGVLQAHPACQRCKRARCLFPGRPCMAALTPAMVWDRVANTLASRGGSGMTNHRKPAPSRIDPGRRQAARIRPPR
jgi:ADP-heptose:LPS heptosyltransferase